MFEIEKQNNFHYIMVSLYERDFLLDGRELDEGQQRQFVSFMPFFKPFFSCHSGMPVFDLTSYKKHLKHYYSIIISCNIRQKQSSYQYPPSIGYGHGHEHKMAISHSVKLPSGGIRAKLSQSAMTLSFKVPPKSPIITFPECKCAPGQLEVVPIPM